jgi:hypothetical protein
MRVRLERTGGFANIRRTFTTDAASLPPERVQELRRLVKGAGLEELAAAPPQPAQGADRFSYAITVEDEGVERAVTFSEDAAPPALQALIDWLQGLQER